MNVKGGTGKTTIADELAFWADREGIAYNYYDLDQQGGAIHEPCRTKGAKIDIIDTPGALRDDLNEWVKGADLIIVPVKASIRDIPPLETTIKVIEEQRKQRKTIIVINNYNRFAAAADFHDMLSDRYKDYQITTIAQSELFIQSAAAGKSVIEYKSNSTPANDIRALINIVKERIG